MRLIEFTELVKIGGREYTEGARDSFDDAEAQQYIDLGWAKDPETGEQGERKPGSNGPIQVHNVVSEFG